MTKIIETEIHGFAALVLENAHVRACILPELGGRIWELSDIARGVQWIWHRPDVPLARHEPGADYDAVWAGGWEELFPNDAAGEFEGRDLPDHGEWWASPWQVEHLDEQSGSVRLSARLNARRVRCTKEIRLPANDSAVTIAYTIASDETEPFHFLFKQHLPIAIAPGFRLEVPGGRMVPVSLEFSRMLRGSDEALWPGTDVDLSIIPAKGTLQEFVYIRDLPVGECAVVSPEAGARLSMVWELSDMPFLWFFMSYGGWRDVYTVVLEPCTNMPKELDKARELGQAALLMPGQSFSTVVRVQLDAAT